jgi:mannose/fructose/N-acetylgalactosamine-specific phosphotransferase system component IIB
MSQEWGLVRIDDRLIHGQVIAVWCKHRPFTRIVIVDDEVAADSFMQEVMRLAAPPGLRVDVLSLEEAIRHLPQDPHPRETTMVLLRSPQTALRLYEGGVRYMALNVGGLGSGPGRRPLFRHIAASDEEIAALKGPGRARSGHHVSDGAGRESPFVQRPSGPLNAVPEITKGTKASTKGTKVATYF